MTNTAGLSEEAAKLLPAFDALSMKDRIGLARRFLAEPEVSETEEVEIREAWQAEISRRIDELKTGKVEGIPADEVFRQMREKYG